MHVAAGDAESKLSLQGYLTLKSMARLDRHMMGDKRDCNNASLV